MGEQCPGPWMAQATQTASQSLIGVQDRIDPTRLNPSAKPRAEPTGSPISNQRVVTRAPP